jgi:hydrogenase-4 component B
VPQWTLKFLVPAIGALLALSAALAAACFVEAFGVTFLGRPRSETAARAHKVDRISLGAMFAFAGLCLFAGVFPGLIIDGLAPVVMALTDGARLPVQTTIAWLTVVLVSAGRSSYNGLLVLLFVAFSAGAAAYVIHRFALHAVRRAAPWDCGFPDPSPMAQYTAGSFAQPIRRVFGTLAFRAREEVDMAPPGDLRPAHLDIYLHDLVWDAIYAPVAGAVGLAADRLNHLQFLTIRRYLTLVFLALVFLLLVLAIWR